MEPLVVVGLGSFGILLTLVMSLAQPRRHERFGDRAGPLERSCAAQAEVEDTDIEQMIEARNDIRRHRGLPEIGDDLVASLTTTDRR
ncbi:hypothetical protein [Capillimicrobium parvum]|uniref:Uncharacterized protein n=1 Tax=Capillimicrobium parvum TaxID=2884022 RepID=A0A9E6XWI8_9ACTN|nr:hypothetical protein [Capillimicrobium parvum]UGS35750.1 hypothetical protein DSM104329_02145 [Capillimicrobium parvum]